MNLIFKDTTTKNFVNNWVSFGNIASPIISKNACSTLFALANKYSITDTYTPICWLGKKYSLSDVKDCFKFAVIRNPLERIESAYNTIGYNMPVKEYVDNVVEALSSLDNSEINRHIASLFYFYNINDIDIFVPIESLSEYLKSININPIKINCSKNPIKIKDSRLDILLKDDFEIYNKLLQKSYVAKRK